MRSSTVPLMSVAAVLTAMCAVPPAVAVPTQSGDKVRICHRTTSLTNPYVSIEVAQDSVDGSAGNDRGRGDHFLVHTGPVWTPESTKKVGWGDIIPPIPGIHDGLNWTAVGEAIWSAGCVPANMTDTDGDGIPDLSDDDVDGDKSPDAVDPDDDGDETPDVADPDEPGAPDSDGDGTPDGADSDNPGLTTDTDRDNTPDALDVDDDGDGTPDAADRDDDGDGTPDTSDSKDPGSVPDTDGDGTPDATDRDDDGDGTPDTTDRDDDGDGSPDTRDPDEFRPTDTDRDTIPDSIDSDDDGDGVRDDFDCAVGNASADCNTSGDVVPPKDDKANPDKDGDGVPNRIDPDDDGDGNPDVTDPDDDNDGIPDVLDPDTSREDRDREQPSDTDGDRIPDAQDRDDDGDGVPDTRDRDADGNGQPETKDQALTDDQLPSRIVADKPTVLWDEEPVTVLGVPARATVTCTPAARGDVVGRSLCDVTASAGKGSVTVRSEAPTIVTVEFEAPARGEYRALREVRTYRVMP